MAVLSSDAHVLNAPLTLFCMHFEFNFSEFGEVPDHYCEWYEVKQSMFGILVLCLGYSSYVWDISLMSGILVLCLGYLSYV